MERRGQQVVHVPVAVVDEDVGGAGGERALDGGVGLGDHQVDRGRVADVRGVGRVRVADPADALHVDADVDPHASSSVGPVRAGWPIQTCPSAKRSAFQIGRPGLGLVDRVAGGLERGRAMRGDRHDRDRDLAERHLPRAVDDGDAADPEARLDLVGDRLERGQRHRLVRLVLQRLHAAAGMARGLGLLARRRRARRLAGPPEEPDRPRRRRDRPGGRPARRGCRRPAAPSRSSSDPRCPEPPDTGGIIATSSPSSSAVAGVGVGAVAREPDGRAAGRQHRMPLDEREPGVLDGRRRPRSSTATSRVPASSRWIAKRRMRTRTATAVPAPVSRATWRSAGRRRAAGSSR